MKLQGFLFKESKDWEAKDHMFPNNCYFPDSRLFSEKCNKCVKIM
jgi:hypothetical protein